MSDCVRRTRTARDRLHVGAKRAVTLLAMSLILAGCAVLERWNAPKSQPPAPHTAAVAPAPQAPPPVPPKPRRVIRETHESKEPEKVASLDPKNLIGLQPAAVEKLLGSPSNVSSSDPSLVWTYAGQGCSFQVFFYPDLKTATFHALKYSSTANDQIENACIRSILTVKNNGPS
jgi:hypothetical protein